MKNLQQQIVQERPLWLEGYKKFLSFPSISALAESKPDLEACAAWVAAELREIGFTVEFWQTEGPPVLFASLLEAGPAQPTLLLYNHYDVQPVDPLELWDSPPFNPVEKKGEIYARGAQDNKGQCFYVLQALKMYRKEFGKLPINVKLCIEGEEEIGSPGLSSMIYQKQGALQADYLAIVDVGLPAADIPALTLGVRGIVTWDLVVQGAKGDLHSGSHGGMAPNPLQILVELLARLKDSKGKVAVPGFYEGIEEPAPHELALLDRNFDPLAYQQMTGVDPNGGEADYPPLDRVWLRPALEINGIHGGYGGKGFKTIIPARAEAKLSCRLVPGQDPVRIGALIPAFLQQHAPSGIRLQITTHPGLGRPVRIPPDSALVQAFSAAFEKVLSKKTRFILSGASIPIAAQLAEVSGAQSLFVGLGLPDDQIHAPNEHFGIDRIEKGILIIAHTLHHLRK